MDFKDRIIFDPSRRGRPFIAGTRIAVFRILDLLAAGKSFQDVLEEYPKATQEDVLACIAYGAEAARQGFVPSPLALEVAERILEKDDPGSDADR